MAGGLADVGELGEAQQLYEGLELALEFDAAEQAPHGMSLTTLERVSLPAHLRELGVDRDISACAVQLRKTCVIAVRVLAVERRDDRQATVEVAKQRAEVGGSREFAAVLDPCRGLEDQARAAWRGIEARHGGQASRFAASSHGHEFEPSSLAAELGVCDELEGVMQLPLVVRPEVAEHAHGEGEAVAAFELACAWGWDQRE